jgi:hypothetical protein
MMADTGTIHRALSLILISRNLERIGDHATNIGEEVIYWIQGRDVRHRKGLLPDPAPSNGPAPRAESSDRAAAPAATAGAEPRAQERE